MLKKKGNSLMKNFIKKTAATTLSVFGILSAMPSAFCAPEGANNNPGNNGNSRLNGFYAMTVGKYLRSVEDIHKLTMVNKKYENLADRYYFNPVEIDSEKEAAFFPRMQTYCCRKFDKNIFYKFNDNKNIKRLVYLPFSFEPSDLKKVLIKNNVTDEDGELNDGWERNLEINDNDPMEGCRVTFKNGDKEIIFMFSPIYNEMLMNFKWYNNYLQECGIDEGAAKVALKEEIVVPSNVTCIGKKAFEYCKNLTKITIPDGATGIGPEAFSGCIHLVKVNIPSSVKIIAPEAFYCCYNLKEINIPHGVTAIEEETFLCCRNLTKINIPNSVTSIGDHAFGRCSNLTEISIPSSVMSIGNGAFYACSNLTKINISNGVRSIGYHAFQACDNLTKISIPNSVTSIDPDAFTYCENLNHIEYNGEVYTTVDSFMEAFNAQHNNANL